MHISHRMTFQILCKDFTATVNNASNNCYTVKPVSSGHTKEDQQLVFKTDYRLVQVKRIADSALSYHLSLRPLFCLFLAFKTDYRLIQFKRIAEGSILQYFDLH